jgi:hypothetical protein
LLQDSKSVLIEGCMKIRYFSPLRNVPKVMISGCPGFSQPLRCGECQRTTLINLPGFKDAKMLGNIRHLIFSQCRLHSFEVRRSIVLRKSEERIVHHNASITTLASSMPACSDFDIFDNGSALLLLRKRKPTAKRKCTIM